MILKRLEKPAEDFWGVCCIDKILGRKHLKVLDTLFCDALRDGVGQEIWDAYLADVNPGDMVEFKLTVEEGDACA